MSIDLEYFEVEINGRIHPIPKHEFSPCEKQLGKEGYMITIWDSNIEAAKQVIVENGIKHISIATSDLNFLLQPEFKDIEGIYINCHIKDLAPLENIKEIKFLDLRCDKKGKIDFKCFPNLKYLNCEYSKRYKNLTSLHKLESLSLDGYTETDLEEFGNFRNLTELYLIFANCQSLKGLHLLTKLQKLTLDECKKLVTLNGLGKDNAIFELKISDCRNLKDFSSLDKLNPNCDVFLNGKIYISGQDSEADQIALLVNNLHEIGCEKQIILEIQIVLETLKKNIEYNDWKKELKICVVNLNKIADKYDAIYTEEREEIISTIQYILVDYSSIEVEKNLDKFRNW